MVPWIKKLDAKEEWPVILRISILIGAGGELATFAQTLANDLGDSEPPISWCFCDHPIPIGLIGIAVHEDPDSALATSCKEWSFEPLGKYDLEEIPDQRSLPDLREIQITNEFEMSEATKAFLDGAKGGNSDGESDDE